MKKRDQKGSVVIYILIAIFLTGMLIAAMTKGSKKNAATAQVDELVLFMQNDIKTIHTAIIECAQTYSKPVAGLTNPNPPFPLYGDLSNGGTGDEITDIKCPGAPTAQQPIFGANAANFKMLSDTATYTTQYFTNGTEGVYFRITSAVDDPLWSETIARLNTKYSQCSAAAVTAPGTCVNGCFYYWAVRLPSSTLGGEVGCP